MRRRHRTHRSMQGFTLLELLLALTVTAIVAAVLYTSVTVASRTRDKAIAKVQQDAAARVAFDVLRQDLQCVPPPTGILRDTFEGEASKLTMTTSNPRWPAADRRADLVRVTYRLEIEGDVLLDDLSEADEGTTYRLVREVQTRLLAPEADVIAESQVIAAGLSGWSLRYTNGGPWQDAWSSPNFANAAPAMVEITLAFAGDSARSVAQSMRLPAGPVLGPNATGGLN